MTIVTSSFPGTAFPPGTHVEFQAKRGNTFNWSDIDGVTNRLPKTFVDISTVLTCLRC